MRSTETSYAVIRITAAALIALIVIVVIASFVLK